MAKAKKLIDGRSRAARAALKDRGEPGTCRECHTQRRPVSHYASTVKYDCWLCDRCVVDLWAIGVRFLPWEQRELFQVDGNAAYNHAPKEPALRRRPVAGEDRVEEARAAFSPAGWQEEDDEDDRRLRLSELRHLGVAVADLFQGGATPDEERGGLLRVITLLQARMRELGG